MNQTLLVSIESGITDGWRSIQEDLVLNIGINTFGESGPGTDVAGLGLLDSIYNKILKKLGFIDMFKNKISLIVVILFSHLFTQDIDPVYTVHLVL